MDIHKTARLTPHSRVELVRRVFEEGQTRKAVAAAFGVCPKTLRKRVKRFQEEGPKSLQDRSSRPHRLRRPTPQPTVRRIEALRRERRSGQQIAAEVGGLAGHHQPRPAPPWPQHTQGPGAGRAGAALRA